MVTSKEKTRGHEHPEYIKAAVLLAVQSGMGVNQAAATYDVPQQTVSRWLHLPDINPLVSYAKSALDAKFEDMAHRLINAAPDKIEDASLLQTMTSAAIAVDKMRLLREQPTTIAGVPKSVEERDKLLMAVLDEIERNAVDIDPNPKTDACDP